MIRKILGGNGKICFVLSPTQVHRIEEKELLTNRRDACFLLMVLLVRSLAKAVVRCKRRLEACCSQKPSSLLKHLLLTCQLHTFVVRAVAQPVLLKVAVKELPQCACFVQFRLVNPTR